MLVSHCLVSHPVATADCFQSSLLCQTLYSLVDTHLAGSAHNMKLCSCTVVGVALDMCGVLLDDGFLFLLWSSDWVRFSPQLLGQLGGSFFHFLALYSCIAHLSCSLQLDS
jgi:hypothetical protein